MTKAQVIALIDQYITTNGNEEITGAQTNSVMKALANQDLPFGDLINKPTTLSGYGITDAYTKSASDGRYVNVTGDTMTGQLSATNLRTTNQGDGATLLTFDTERPWSFKQSSTGATTALSLVESAATGSKNFTIGDLTTPDKVTISSGTGNITTIGTVTGSNLSGTNTGDQTLSGLGGVPTSRQINTGNHLSGGGNLSANRTLTLTPTVDNWIVDSQGNQRMYFNSAATVTNGIIFKASAATQRLQYRDVNNNQVFTVDDSGNVTATSFSGSIDASNIDSGKLADTRLQVSNVTQFNNAINPQQVNGIRLWDGTQAEYDAISNKRNDTLYFITQ